MLLHCVQVKFGAVAPQIFKFEVELNLTPSRYGSRCVKFEVKFTNLAKFDFKFERKTIRRSIVR
ncbi:hypothetical protein [Campylobacter rectus]|uniref:hypothetical protein n=1 Tax=Campylobacter rectus TaxID=203 RepID=UPI0023F225F7|nr:hypothetical protein [Campylobacter rectus]